MSVAHRLSAVMCLACFLGACGDPASTCVRSADCASNVCRADGTCAPIASTDGPVAEPDGSVTDAPMGCVPNLDNVITAAESQFMLPRDIPFATATNEDVDTRGEVQNNGQRAWDFSAALPSDEAQTWSFVSPDGAWWQPEFPDATYAGPLSGESSLSGVFRVTESAVSLLGVVSPTGGLTRTEVHYDPPIDVLRYPLSASSAWTQTASITGVVNGIISVYEEAYDVRVDALGTVATPYGTFPALRVAVDLTKTIGLVNTTTKSFVFVTECFGSVATVVSQANETQAEFSAAAEVRRLAP